MSESQLDREAFETLKSMTDPAFIIELIDVFLSDSPEQIELIRAGIAAGNVEQVRRAAHSLKSNSASFGAARVAGLSREIEMVAKRGEALEGAGPLLAELAAEYQKLVPLLQELKNEL